MIALPALRGAGHRGAALGRPGLRSVGARRDVAGRPDVWAVGDGGSFPVKQGGIACQQADVAAAAIARGLGAEVGEIPFEPVLRGWLWDGAGGRFLRADLRGGHDESPGATDDRPLWWPVAKVAGRFLAPVLQEAPEPALADVLPGPRPAPE